MDGFRFQPLQVSKHGVHGAEKSFLHPQRVALPNR
jgi:hypothetical protein